MTSPNWYDQKASPRPAVTLASFCRKLPAPAFRGLTGTESGFLPAAIRTTFSASLAAFSFSKASIGKYTSPRTSSTDGILTFDFDTSVLGTTSIVKTLAVTSSPKRPSPRVAA